MISGKEVHHGQQRQKERQETQAGQEEAGTAEEEINSYTFK